MPANMKKAGMKYQKGGQGPKASNYVGNPMGYFNDKAMYGREKMMMQDGGGYDFVTGNAADGKITKKPKRRTVTVTTKNPRPGTVGGSPVTTKTITKNKRNGKTVTKTKSVRNPIGPFNSTVSKSKTVTKSGPKGPMGMSQKTTVKDSGSNKQVSQRRGRKIQSRMNKKG